MSKEDNIINIPQYLKKNGWIKKPEKIQFLAQGEYNENYLVTEEDGTKHVFRINHGSQLGMDDQIGYEFKVLKAIEPSGVTPRPEYYDSTPADFNGGVLLMEFLPGVHLNYKKDLKIAAEIFSKIHDLSPSWDLITQLNPILDIGNESKALIERFPDHPLKKERDQLLSYHNQILQLGKQHDDLFKNRPLNMVNTEVNSSNFLIQDQKGYLVDWEKAVVSSRYQDLGHFLVPTTTLWKTDTIYTEEEKLTFLRHYQQGLSTKIPMEELQQGSRLLEKTILLRGLSWCFMAYYEYTSIDRALKNMDTFQKIKDYLQKIDWFLTESL